MTEIKPISFADVALSLSDPVVVGAKDVIYSQWERWVTPVENKDQPSGCVTLAMTPKGYDAARTLPLLEKASPETVKTCLELMGRRCAAGLRGASSWSPKEIFIFDVLAKAKLATVAFHGNLSAPLRSLTPAGQQRLETLRQQLDG